MSWKVVIAALALVVAGCAASSHSKKAKPSGPSPMACEQSLERGSLTSTADRAACEGMWCFRNSNVDAKCFTSESQCQSGRRFGRPGIGGTGCSPVF